MENKFDIVIIGSGPGGYTAAIRAAQLGSKVAIIEKYDALGGTCTNVGCIPAKALLDSTEHYTNAVTKFHLHGIHAENISIDMAHLVERKRSVVNQNVSGLQYLMKKNKITVLNRTASFINNKLVRVINKEGKETQVEATFFIIATGSKPSTVNGIVIDKKRSLLQRRPSLYRRSPKVW